MQRPIQSVVLRSGKTSDAKTERVEDKSIFPLEAFFDLSEDFPDTVLGFLPVKDSMAAFCGSRGLLASGDNELNWRLRYLEYVGPEIFKRDYKAQVRAARSHAKAASHHRSDKNDYYVKCLYDFLKDYHHLEKDWAQFYLGCMYYSGEMVPQDRARGLRYLDGAVRGGDYRAAQFMAEKLCPDFFALLNEVTEVGAIERIQHCLLYAYEKLDVSDVAVAIGFVKLFEAADAAAHASEVAEVKAIAVSAARASAREWFLKALETNPNSVPHDLSNLNLVDSVDEFKAMTTAMQKIFYDHPSGILAYQLALLYHQNNEHDPDYQLTREWLERSAFLDNSQALMRLACLFLGGFGVEENKEKGYELFQMAMQNGNGNAALEYAEYIKTNGHHPVEVLAIYKRGFHSNNNICASYVSSLCREQKDWQDTPRSVVWVQAAAQCGCEESGRALEELQFTHHYAACAIAIICALGCSTPYIASDQTKAVEVISSVPWDERQRYLDALRAEELLEHYITALFTAWEKQPQLYAAPTLNRF